MPVVTLFVFKVQVSLYRIKATEVVEKPSAGNFPNMKFASSCMQLYIFLINRRFHLQCKKLVKLIAKISEKATKSEMKTDASFREKNKYQISKRTFHLLPENVEMVASFR
jgi:hypothetical protein